MQNPECKTFYVNLSSGPCEGGGGQKLAKSCLRSLWVPPMVNFLKCIQNNDGREPIYSIY